MANITNTLIANITATEDSTQNVIINRSTGNPQFDSTLALMQEYISLAAMVNVVLPGTPVVQVYIRNIDSAKNVTVAWTPNGGASNNVILLYPGDQIILWQKPGGTNAGITGLTLTPSAAGCLVEFFLGV